MKLAFTAVGIALGGFLGICGTVLRLPNGFVVTVVLGVIAGTALAAFLGGRSTKTIHRIIRNTARRAGNG